VLADEGLERGAAAHEGGHLGAKLVAAAAGLVLLAAARVELETEIGDAGFKALEALGDGLEGELDLAALLAEAVSSSCAAPDSAVRRPDS